MPYTDQRGARRAWLAAGLFAALALPFAAAAQSDDEDELSPAAVDALLRGPGPADASPGAPINGWFFERKNGTCRMYSFNDPLVLEANATGAQLQFRIIDGEIPEAHGSTVPVTVLLRDMPDDPYEELQGNAIASRTGAVAAYLFPVRLDEIIDRYPYGFELSVVGTDGYEIIASDTQGSQEHLAALKACMQRR